HPLASFAVILPPMEFMLGAMLVSGRHVYAAAQWVVSLTLLFTLVYTYGLLTKGITDCGCFGNVEFMKLPPWGLYLRNAVLMGAALWVASSSKRAAGNPRIIGAREIALTLLGAAAFLTAGMSYKGPLLKQQQQAASTWHWQPRSATPFAQLQLSPDSAYALYLYRPDCPLCKDVAANAASWREAGLVDAVIALTSIEYHPAVDSLFVSRYGRYFDRLDYLGDAAMAKATSYVPTLVVIQSDTVRHVQIGKVPSGFRLIRREKLVTP